MSAVWPASIRVARPVAPTLETPKVWTWVPNARSRGIST